MNDVTAGLGATDTTRSSSESRIPRKLSRAFSRATHAHYFMTLGELIERAEEGTASLERS